MSTTAGTTHHTTATADATADEAAGLRRRFLRSWAPWAALLYVGGAVNQVLASLLDDDQEVRDAVASDLTFVMVASVVFGGVALVVALRALRKPADGQARTVVGLTAYAVVLSVVGWFCAAPTLSALTAVVLARTAGVATPERRGARAAVVVCVVVVIGLTAFTWTALIAENL